MDGECYKRDFHLCCVSALDCISELLVGVFVFCQLEMKQRYLVGKLNIPDDKEGGQEEVTMETLGEDSS